MKVLITGSSGFLGNEFTQLLNKKKYHCFFCREENKKKNMLNVQIKIKKNLNK